MSRAFQRRVVKVFLRIRLWSCTFADGKPPVPRMLIDEALLEEEGHRLNEAVECHVHNSKRSNRMMNAGEEHSLILTPISLCSKIQP